MKDMNRQRTGLGFQVAVDDPVPPVRVKNRCRFIAALPATAFSALTTALLPQGEELLRRRRLLGHRQRCTRFPDSRASLWLRSVDEAEGEVDILLAARS